MAADDDRGTGPGADHGAGDVERYEQLRRGALAGDAAGWRSGMAVLQHHGLAAWLRAWRTLGPPCPPRAATPGRAGPPTAAADRLVAGLASMALGALAGG